jgi:hypothetical protein
MLSLQVVNKKGRETGYKKKRGEKEGGGGNLREKNTMKKMLDIS